MPYQLAFAMYLISATANSLLARRYAIKTTLHPLVSGILTNAVIALPLALLYALLTGSLMMPTMGYAVVAVVEALAGTAYGAVALYAQKHSDASTFTTLIKTQVLIVVAASSLLFGETLSTVQVFGAGLVLLSGLLLSKGMHLRGLQYNLVAVPLLSIVVIFGRIMVKDLNVGMYLVTASILGLIIKLVIKGRVFLSHLPEIKTEFRQRSVLSITTFLQVLFFILSVDLSGNVSYISSLASFKVITVMVASYFLLGERADAKKKSLAAVLSLFGILLM